MKTHHCPSAEARRAAIVLFAAVASSAPAGQVTTDSSFGRAPQTLSAPNYDIPASLGKTVGNNLFHSFGQFDLDAGDTATFSGPNNIQNILSRVTGGNPSHIDGTIQSTIPGANLFFMNPAGIVFGKNAQVNVGGSFAITTASYIKLAGGGRFDAVNPARDVLVVAPPVAFGFLGPTAAPISMAGGDPNLGEPSLDLQVPAGKSFSLIGGDIQIANANLFAPGGGIDCISVGSKGELNLRVGDLVSPVNVRGFSKLGSISFVNSALDVEDSRGGRVVVGGESLSMDFSQVFSSSSGDENALSMEIEVRDSLSLVGGSFISSFTAGAGNAGDIDLYASSIVLDGQGLGGAISSTANLDSTGNAGNIRIRTGSLVLENAVSINTQAGGSGAGGDITVTAKSVHLDGEGNAANLDASTFGGKAGDIVVKTSSLTVENGARVSTETFGTAAGGRIVIRSGVLQVAGGQITASSQASGNGGAIEVKARNLTLRDGASVQSAATGEGDAGGISLNVGDSLAILDNSSLSVSAAQSSGGRIGVLADTVRIVDSQVSAEAGETGGNIRLFALSAIDLLNSTVSAKADNHGGNIQLGPPFFLFDPRFTGTMDPTTINASAVEVGGNISIGRNFSIDPSTVIKATGAEAGNVEIGVPEVDLSGSLVPLIVSLLDTESILQPYCGIRLQGGPSSFTVVGRGGTPVAPDKVLPSLELYKPAK